jgi:hypothetical protein
MEDYAFNLQDNLRVNKGLATTSQITQTYFVKLHSFMKKVFEPVEKEIGKNYNFLKVFNSVNLELLNQMELPDFASIIKWKDDD